MDKHKIISLVHILINGPLMIYIGYFKPKSDQEIAISDEKTPAPVDMTPWPLAKKVSAGIFGSTIAIYLLLTALAN